MRREEEQVFWTTLDENQGKEQTYSTQLAESTLCSSKFVSKVSIKIKTFFWG